LRACWPLRISHQRVDARAVPFGKYVGAKPVVFAVCRAARGSGSQEVDLVPASILRTTVLSHCGPLIQVSERRNLRARRDGCARDRIAHGLSPCCPEAGPYWMWTFDRPRNGGRCRRRSIVKGGVAFRTSVPIASRTQSDSSQVPGHARSAN